MSSEKKKRVPVKKAKLSRRVVRKSATGQFIAQKASSRRDKLLFKVRKQLRQKHGFSRGTKKFGVACVYSAETVMYPQADGTVCEANPESRGSIKLDCKGGWAHQCKRPAPSVLLRQVLCGCRIGLGERYVGSIPITRSIFILAHKNSTILNV